MTAKHTQGPWYVGEANLSNHKYSHIGVRSDEWVVCEVQMDVEDLPGEANAQIIAAAPDLLEAADKALNTLIGCCIAIDESDREEILQTQSMLRAALAKAKGEPK